MTVSVVGYRSEFAKAFAELNREWIETHFAMEPEDERSLGDPEGYVLAGGGEIFFALDDGRSDPVGTVAMVAKDAARFELAKMAVTPEFQGRGIGKQLMAACIQFARAQQATEIVLTTNNILAPAMGLYEQAGFVRLPQLEDARYARGNTEMRLELDAVAHAPAEIEKL